MKEKTTQFFLDAAQGTLIQGDPKKIIRGISTDTRSLQPGDLFIPLKGPNFNGHHFIPMAASRGAAAVFSEQENFEIEGLSVIRVSDTLNALHKAAEAYRQTVSTQICALTGSFGKTSTKEILTQALKSKFITVKSPANENNQIGLAKSIFLINENCEKAVFEMGSNHPGEINTLAEICKANIAIITGIGPSHLEGFGDLDGVFREKSSLVDHIRLGGALVLSSDSPYLDAFREMTDHKIITAGKKISSQKESPDIEISEIKANAKGGIQFLANGIQVSLPLWGSFQAQNAGLALAAGQWMGCEIEEMAKALKKCSLPGARGALQKYGDSLIINDAYNANPQAMKEALENLSLCDRSYQRVAVLGDMLELGKDEIELHREISEFSKAAGVERIFLTGSRFREVLGDFESSLGKSSVKWVESWKKIPEEVEGILRHRACVLFKGSHSIGLDQAVKQLFRKKREEG